MADFDRALQYVLRWEGVYSLDPDDPGGETYCGISRKNWPDWIGWDKIDALKAKGILSTKIPLPELAESVWDFYHTQFWACIDGDHIEDQEVAEYVFDTAVNLGVVKALKMLALCGNDVSVIRDMIDWRLDYYIDKVCEKPAKVKYLNGWRNRARRKV